MSWAALLAPAAGTYVRKAIGPLVLGDGDKIVLDARLPALAVAGVCVWRGAPLLVTVVAAAVVAAALRAL